MGVSLTLRARAAKTGMPSSAEVSGVYTLTVPTPTVSPVPTTYSTDVTVTATCLAGATLRYTTDGTTPTETTGTVYTGPVAVTRAQVLRFGAFKTGWTSSGQNGGTYTMKVATPTFAPPTGSFDAAQTVTLATTTPGATLRWTSDGREPTEADPAATSVPVDRTLLLKVRAFRTGWTTSDSALALYTLTLGVAAAPTMDPPAGALTAPAAVVLASATPGAQIRYTLDGSDPTLLSERYRAPDPRRRRAPSRPSRLRPTTRRAP